MKIKLIKKGIIFIIILIIFISSITATSSRYVRKTNINDKITSNIQSNNRVKNRGNWWDDNWNYYRIITIDSDYIDDNLNNFPILANSTNSNLISKCDNGNSVRFLSLDNLTEFYYEIEDWTDNGFSIWVNISETITSSTDYKFLMYYNNSAAVDDQNPENVWDSGYSVVLHMDEISGTVHDSTSYNNDAYLQNNVTQDVVGKIDGADNFDGDKGHLTIDDDSSIELGSDGTVEAWFNWDVEKFSGGIIHKGDKADWSDESYSLQGWERQHRIGAYIKGTTNLKLTSATNTLQTGEWYYAVLTWGTFGAKLIINTVEEDSDSSTTIAHDTSGHLNIGTQLNESYPTYGYFPLDGTIDEVRISQIARSPSWLKACFHTQNQTPGFLTFRPERTKPVDNIPPTVEIDTPHYGCIYFTIAGTQYVYIPCIPFITLIIGKIYIIVNATDNMGVESVEFYIDDILRHTDSEPPYIWLWDERTMLFTYEIKVIARDYRGNEATDNVKVWRVQIRQPEG